MSVNPGPLRSKTRASGASGEDPPTRRAPEEFAPKLAELRAPERTGTGKIYDFPQGRKIKNSLLDYIAFQTLDPRLRRSHDQPP